MQEGHTEYDDLKRRLTNKQKTIRKLTTMVDMYDLLAYVRHCEPLGDIDSPLGAVNRELVVYDKNEWIKRYVDFLQR